MRRRFGPGLADAHPMANLGDRITEATQGLGGESRPNIPVGDGGDGPQALTTDTATPIAPRADAQHALRPAAPERGPSLESRQDRPSRPAPPPPPQYQSQYVSRPLPPTSNRVASPTGGVQLTLDGGGSWSELARQDATLPADAATAADAKHEGSGGVFGFLKGKRGRNNSPKPRERGVLGKEGARVVIS